jgi:hypothetical protein
MQKRVEQVQMRARPHLAAPDRISVQRAGPEIRWRLVTTWLMRLLSALWMMRAVFEWAEILGAAPERPPFEDMAFNAQVTLCVFAVLHTIAAVGLWLSSGWGGVVWVILTLGEMILFFMLPLTEVTSGPLILFSMVFLVLYVLLVIGTRLHGR